MQDRPQNPGSEDDASENTLVTPRFDADEARRAHPVVPLADALRADELTAHGAFRRRARRSWPLGVVIVSLLAVATAGGIASKVLRRENAPQAAPPATQQAEAQPPAQSLSAAPPREESRATGDAREGRAQRGARRTHDTGPAREDEIFVPHDDEDNDDEKDRGRGRGTRKHRKDEDDDGDFGKAVKGAKKKAVRVGVIIGN